MRTTAICLAILLTSAFVLGEDVDIPLHNWTVPPYARPSGGLTPMTDVTPPRVFIGIVPCRVADTRGNGAPIQGGIFANSQARDWTVWGVCGIPSGADAISVNFTVVSTAATPQGAFLLAWPTGSPPVAPTAIMTYGPGATVISNAAIVPLNGSGQLTVNVSHSTHIIMDINGYFSDSLSSAGNPLVLANNSPGGTTALFTNASNTNMSTGVLGLTGPAFAHPTNYFAAGVRGEGTLTGVLGISQSLGVGGSLVSGAGAETAYGILGFNTGNRFGVYGFVAGGDAGDAAVFGTSEATGVLGVSQDGTPVEGRNLSGTGTLQTAGFLAPDSIYGVFAVGNVGASGTKPFVEPHPVDPTKEIVFVALEGPEAGTYFRGKGRFQRGVAVIDVPEDFRMVTDPEDLGIQVTPIGELSTVAVVSIGLDRIVVKGSRDVAFFYTVNGVRKAFRDHASIAANVHYVPEGPNARMPGAYAPEQRRRLIETGIYNEDGTVNMETARRLGWDKDWERRSRPAPEPTP